MSSLPESYWPTLQTITAVECMSTLLGTLSSMTMKPSIALTALSKKQRTRKQCSNKGKEKSTSSAICKNCKSSGHTKANCWLKEGGKESQGPRGWNSKKGEKKAETVAAAEVTSNVDEIFAFTCTSDYVEVTNALNIPKSWLGTYINSGASQHYSPDHDVFINYSLISNTTIATADGCKLKALGKGDVQIELLDSAKHTKTIVKEAIYAPDMAFTLILVSQLDDMKCSVTFSSGMCTICNPSSCTMVTIPCANCLYCITAAEEPPHHQLCEHCDGQVDYQWSPLETWPHHTFSYQVHDCKRPHYQYPAQPWVKAWILWGVCQGQSGSTTLPKGIGNLCLKIWRVRPLGPVGTSFSPKPQQKLVCGSMHRWCNLWNHALFPSKEKPNH